MRTKESATRDREKRKECQPRRKHPSPMLFCVSLLFMLLGLNLPTAEASLKMKDDIILQMKYVPPYKMPKKNDPAHTIAFFESSVQLFLSNAFRKMDASSKFSDTEVFRVQVRSQVLATPRQSNNQLGQSTLRKKKKKKMKRKSDGGRLLRRTLNSDGIGLDDNMRPTHINVTIAADFTPLDEQTTLTNAEFGEMILSAFNSHSRDLVERLQDLTDVLYFRHVSEVEALPPLALKQAMIQSRAADVPMETAEEKVEKEALFYKETTAIAAIIVGACGLILMSVGLIKVVSMRRAYRLVDQKDAASFPSSSRDNNSSWGRWPFSTQQNLHETRPSFHPYGPRPAHTFYEYSQVGGYRDNLALSKGDDNVVARKKQVDVASVTTAETEKSSLSGRDGSRRMAGLKSAMSGASEGRSKKPDRKPYSTLKDEAWNYDDLDRPSSAIADDSRKREAKKSESSVKSSPSKASSSKSSRSDRSSSTGRSKSSAESRSTKDDATRASSSSKSTRSSEFFMNLKAESYDGVRRECFAPAGKLGVAIDTGPGGIGPVVHKLKAGSPLEGILKPGDRIMAVDDEDTRFLSAAKVTKMMVRGMDKERKITYMTLGS